MDRKRFLCVYKNTKDEQIESFKWKQSNKVGTYPKAVFVFKKLMLILFKDSWPPVLKIGRERLFIAENTLIEVQIRAFSPSLRFKVAKFFFKALKAM